MIVNVRYHQEGGTVWADSPEVDGFHVTGDTLDEVRDLVREGLMFYLEVDDADLDIRESLIDPTQHASVTFMTGMPGATPGSRPDLTFGAATRVHLDFEVNASPIMPGARVPTPA